MSKYPVQSPQAQPGLGVPRCQLLLSLPPAFMGQCDRVTVGTTGVKPGVASLLGGSGEGVTSAGTGEQ